MVVNIIYDKAVRARDVINLTSPRTPFEISNKWPGKLSWHDVRYEPLRDLIERRYVEQFNAACGHYERLERDIRKNGVQNPVLLITGHLRKRTSVCLAPEHKTDPRTLVSEEVGGSRLYIAQRLNLTVPAIINDFGERYPPNAKRIRSEADLLACFPDKPRRFRIHPINGAYFGGMPYTHLKGGFTPTRQKEVRTKIIADCIRMRDEWLKEYDR